MRIQRAGTIDGAPSPSLKDAAWGLVVSGEAADHDEARELIGAAAAWEANRAIEQMVQSGEALDAQQASDMLDVIERRRLLVASRLFENEKDWRLSLDDAGDPAAVSDIAMRRELMIERTARRRLARYQSSLEEQGRVAFRTHQEYLERLEEERHRIKYFPVLFVSAPHLEGEAAGAFPGIPTPLLYATAVLDRHLQIDEFPSIKVPEVKAVVNPLFYSDEFERQVVAYVEEFKPKVVGISNLSEGHHFALKIVRTIKAIAPDVVIILGGSHEDGTNPEVYRRAVRRARADAPQSRPGVPRPSRHTYDLSEAQLSRMERLRTLATEEERRLVDFVVAGDAPFLLMELMVAIGDHPDATPDELKEIVARRKPRFAQAPGSGYVFFYHPATGRIEEVRSSGAPLDRNQLPFIFLRRLTRENRFPVFNYRKTAQVMACLGCKYACHFCYESADQVLYEVPKLQQRRPEIVIKELDLLREQGYEAVFFDDSTFTQNTAVVNKLVALLTERRRQRGVYLEWGCQTTINDVNPELLYRMAEAGCTYIYFGLESAEPDAGVVQKVNRQRGLNGEGGWAERFRSVAGWCRESKIRIGLSLQFGLNETEEQRLRTLELLASVYAEGAIAKNSIALNICTPYPGTEMWVELMKRDGYALPDYRERLERHPGFETAHQFALLPREFADEIYRLAVEKLGDALMGIAPPDGERR